MSRCRATCTSSRTAAADQPSLKVNGKRVTPSIEKGFARIERQWQKGDTIELSLPMPVRRVIAHPQVKADQGKVASAARADRLLPRRPRQ